MPSFTDVELDHNYIHQLRPCELEASYYEVPKNEYKGLSEFATAQKHGLLQVQSTCVITSSSAPWFLRCSPNFTRLCLDSYVLVIVIPTRILQALLFRFFYRSIRQLR